MKLGAWAAWASVATGFVTLAAAINHGIEASRMFRLPVNPRGWAGGPARDGIDWLPFLNVLLCVQIVLAFYLLEWAIGLVRRAWPAFDAFLRTDDA